ncbi:MAG: ferredoxin-type protein NapG [Bacteroidetes bacterium 4484_276]|nr:MAG: ferredoxin-type protein NapG [Bacteroidetes bacterium 4484_276]
MDNNSKTASRRDVLKTVFKHAGLLGLGGLSWGGLVAETKSSDLALRPPGALAAEDFIKACIKCGACVEACPYDTLVLAKPDDNVLVGTPHFEPRDIPCYMCPDIPCVPVCPSGALDIKSLSSDDITTNVEKLDINKSRMGVAMVDKETCLAFWGIQCDSCYRVCPLMGDAISLEFKRNERTGKHAFLQPVVNRDYCTGCGLCEHACITEKPAIFVLPLDVATGKVGDHYIKGWDKKDEERLKNQKEDPVLNRENAEDYLNDMDGLIDE